MNRGIKVLQTSALPLGYGAVLTLKDYIIRFFLCQGYFALFSKNILCVKTTRYSYVFLDLQGIKVYNLIKKY